MTVGDFVPADPGARWARAELVRLFDVTAPDPVSGQAAHLCRLHQEHALRLFGSCGKVVSATKGGVVVGLTLGQHTVHTSIDFANRAVDFVGFEVGITVTAVYLAPTDLSDEEAEIYRALRTVKDPLTPKEASAAAKGVLAMAGSR